MADILTSQAADRARGLVAEVVATGWTLPPDVVEALARLDRLEARRPPVVETRDVTAAYLDEKPAKDVAAVVAAAVADSVHRSAWVEARVKVGEALRLSVIAHSDELCHHFAGLAAPMFAEIGEVAGITADVAALVRTGRQREAELVARAGLTASEVAKLWMLRDKVVGRLAGFGADFGYDVRRWRDPRPVAAANAGLPQASDPLEALLRGVRAGGQPWMPSPAEAEQAARKVAAEVKAAEKQAEAEARKTPQRKRVAFVG